MYLFSRFHYLCNHAYVKSFKSDRRECTRRCELKKSSEYFCNIQLNSNKKFQYPKRTLLEKFKSRNELMNMSLVIKMVKAMIGI